MSCVSRKLDNLSGKVHRGHTAVGSGGEVCDSDGGRVKMATNEWISKAEDVADKVTEGGKRRFHNKSSSVHQRGLFWRPCRSIAFSENLWSASELALFIFSTIS